MAWNKSHMQSTPGEEGNWRTSRPSSQWEAGFDERYGNVKNKSYGGQSGFGSGIDPKMNWLQYGGGGDYGGDWQQGSTEYNPNDPYGDAVSSTNVVGPWTAGAETSGYGQTGVDKSEHWKTQKDTTMANGNGNGNGNGETDDWYGDYIKGWGTKWEGYGNQPTFTSATTIVPGVGGTGKLDAVGQMPIDKFTFNQFQGDPLAAQRYGAGFESPVEDFSYGQFVAPTAAEAAQDPGYQFRLEEGQRALQQSAAAKGMLRTGNTWKDLQRYGQGMATAEYDKVYGRRMGEHQLGYGQALSENQLRYGRRFGEYGTGIEAQRLGEASGLSARQANLAMQQQQFGQGAQAWQQQQGAREAQYGMAIQRAGIEAQMAERGEDRDFQAALENRAAAERDYDRQYREALGEYGMEYDIFEENQRKAFDRLARVKDQGLTAEALIR